MSAEGSSQNLTDADSHGYEDWSSQIQVMGSLKIPVGKKTEKTELSKRLRILAPFLNIIQTKTFICTKRDLKFG